MKKPSSSPTNTISIAGTTKQPVHDQPTKLKSGSVSDDDKSEKRYSSSGYYESPHDDGTLKSSILMTILIQCYFFFFLENKPSRPRRLRDWNDDERRRRKEKMRLDIEKENMKSLMSPIKKGNATFKQISPDDRAAMNILDGTSPNKAKRLRPKTRRYDCKKKKIRNKFIIKNKIF